MDVIFYLKANKVPPNGYDLLKKIIVNVYYCDTKPLPGTLLAVISVQYTFFYILGAAIRLNSILILITVNRY